MKARALVLDFFGTLAEGHYIEAYEHLRRRGVVMTFADFRRATPSRYDGQAHEVWSDTTEYELWQQGLLDSVLRETYDLSKRESVRLSREALEIMQQKPTIIPGAAEFLNLVRPYFQRIVICSNSDLGLQNSIQALGIGGDVDGVVCSADVGARKPHVKMYRSAARLGHTHPSNCVFIGDDLLCDVLAPTAFGMSAIWLSEKPATVGINARYRVSDSLDNCIPMLIS